MSATSPRSSSAGALLLAGLSAFPAGAAAGWPAARAGATAPAEPGLPARLRGIRPATTNSTTARPVEGHPGPHLRREDEGGREAGDRGADLPQHPDRMSQVGRRGQQGYGRPAQTRARPAPPPDHPADDQAQERQSPAQREPFHRLYVMPAPLGSVPYPIVAHRWECPCLPRAGRRVLREVARHLVPGTSSLSGGSSVRQISCAFQHRVWNRQAGGGLSGLGTSPLSRMRSRRAARPSLRTGSGTGTADISATV